ncbi:trace amine-associated receptor 4-like [Chelonoidis abingdonii]|uniref:G-protein coupled receptors family 1 profile domain-containing protein n=1 Tax=Chelonoidis abingdonii TaxID=106734 RepID=A0A8C0GAA7_CHEAB|nr:trace amine-associated receptor 4-like [Chelonoidis abingdonii]XP_032643374.1 trace amine-associated receptor 4-like [Chelonoidis abingdonii]
MNSSNLWSPRNVQYCFDSVNNTCPRNVRSTSSLWAMYIFMVGAIVLTMDGNMLVIISIAYFKHLPSPTSFLICSMATTDFLLSFMVMPYSMIRSIESCWYFGDRFCKILTCCDIMLCTTSIFHLCFISVDRYYAVCDPLYYVTKITIPVIVLFLLISWSVPFLFAFGLVFSELNIVGIEEYVTSIDCCGFCALIFNKLWGVMASLIAFFFPGTVMVVIYVHIFTVARKHARQIANIPSAIKCVSAIKNKISTKKENKATKTLSIVMGVFVFCWLPFFILTIADPFLNFSTPEDLYNAFLWLGYCNSTCNPIIYGLFYSWFRKAFKMIVTGKIFRPDSSTLTLFPTYT